MTDNITKLTVAKSKFSDLAETISIRLDEMVVKSRETPCVAMAVVILKENGDSFVSTIGKGNRIALLGAITDLQYTIAKDGDN